MHFAPTPAEIANRLSLIEESSRDEILVKVANREEIDWCVHTHNRHQIIYVLLGTLHIEVDGVNYFVPERHLVWIPQGVPHRLTSNNRRIGLFTSYFHLEGVDGDQLSIYRADEFVEHNLRFVASCSRIDRVAGAEIFDFVIGFFRLLPRVCRKASFPTQPHLLIKDSQLKMVLDYIKENLSKDLTIAGVASHFGFSTRNLTRLFTASNIRFVHYLNYHRVVRAIEILTDNAMNIEQTAYEVGFNSANSFSRVFKHITGESPSIYLRK